MEIRVLQYINGASQAEGLTVIIDVFRAFSLACYMADQGAERIIPVADIESAYRLKNEMPGALLVGERDERKPQDFDYGNSPAEMLGVRLEGRTVIHTTSAGTQGIAGVRKSNEIITGSFVNAQAVYNYIMYRKPLILSLVCMGYRGTEPADEDQLLAEYLSSLLAGNEPDFPVMVEKMRTGTGRRFFVPSNQAFSPEADFYLCTRLSIFPFVLKAESWRKDVVELKRINI